MTQANVDLVKLNYEAINSIGRTGDAFVDPEEPAPDLWARVHPDFELHERSDLPDAKAYSGRDESKAFWRKSQELFAELTWTPHEFTDLGDVIVVETTITAVGRGSDARVEVPETDVFRFSEGRLISLKAFPTKEEAMAEARS